MLVILFRIGKTLSFHSSLTAPTASCPRRKCQAIAPGFYGKMLIGKVFEFFGVHTILTLGLLLPAGISDCFRVLLRKQHLRY
jgi:hypothetical protein